MASIHYGGSSQNVDSEKPSSSSSPPPPPPSPPAIKSKLNPNAPEWKPASIETRMLFMTFPRYAAPIHKLDVASFFTKKYGDCVEHVYINDSGRIGMEFGSILFKQTMYPTLILGKSARKPIYINGTKLYLKRYHAEGRV